MTQSSPIFSSGSIRSHRNSVYYDMRKVMAMHAATNPGLLIHFCIESHTMVEFKWSVFLFPGVRDEI